MESVFVQVPGALYASFYERHGEQTTAAISTCLSQHLRGEVSAEVQAEIASTPYPRPRDGTITGKIWEIADRVKQQSGSADREAVIKACIQENININTASTQFSYWKKANP